MSWTLIYDEVTFYSPEGELGFKFEGQFLKASISFLR